MELAWTYKRRQHCAIIIQALPGTVPVFGNGVRQQVCGMEVSQYMVHQQSTGRGLGTKFPRSWWSSANYTTVM